jgi:hypothetical protein
MQILTITAEVDPTNGIQVADVCDSIIDQMKLLKEDALDKMDEITVKSGNLVLEDDDELVGDWVIEERRKGRR